MRYVNLILCILMLLFIGVQYNDPDGTWWMAIYAIPALWTGIAAFGKPILRRPFPNALLLLSITAAAAGTVYYWPKSSNWWAVHVWYNTETAREGMGMMIVTITLLVAWFSGRHQRNQTGTNPT